MKQQPFEITYDPIQGEAMADGVVMDRVEALAAQLKDSTEGQITVASEIYVQGVRLLIAQGRIDPHAVVFKFNGETITFNTDPTNSNLGLFHKHPDGFCDHHEAVCTAYFDARLAIGK